MTTPSAVVTSALPELIVKIKGEVQSSNLAGFKESAIGFIQSINTTLNTDDDFAIAEKDIKSCELVESKIDECSKAVLAEISSVDEVLTTLKEIKALARETRLSLDRTVKQRKDQVRADMISKAKTELHRHLEAVNSRLAPIHLPNIAVDFESAIKGKKTIVSLQQAVNDELSRAIIEANTVADKIEKNLELIAKEAPEHDFLFNDKQQIVLKESDDLRALITSRLATYKEKLEAEEKAKLSQQQTQHVAQEQLTTADTSIASNEEQAPARVNLVSGLYANSDVRRPSDDELIYSLALRYAVDEVTVLRWISSMNLEAAFEKRAKNNQAA